MHTSLLMQYFNNKHSKRLQKFSLSFLKFFFLSLFHLFKLNLKYLNQFLQFFLYFKVCLSSHQEDILYRLNKGLQILRKGFYHALLYK